MFGEFLVGKGLLTQQALEEILEEQKSQRVPFGQLALQQGLIGKKDLLRILSEQSKNEGEPKGFGQLAVAMGLMTQQQVDRLASSQKETYDQLGELLVARRLLTRIQLIELLKEFTTG